MSEDQQYCVVLRIFQNQTEFGSSMAALHVVKVQGHEDIVGHPERFNGVLAAQNQVRRGNHDHQREDVPESRWSPYQNFQPAAESSAELELTLNSPYTGIDIASR